MCVCERELGNVKEFLQCIKWKKKVNTQGFEGAERHGKMYNRINECILYCIVCVRMRVREMFNVFIPSEHKATSSTMGISLTSTVYITNVSWTRDFHPPKKENEWIKIDNEKFVSCKTFLVNKFFFFSSPSKTMPCGMIITFLHRTLLTHRRRNLWIYWCTTKPKYHNKWINVNSQFI